MPAADTPTAATRLALKSLAVRHQQLSAEVGAPEAQLELLFSQAAPDLVAVKGIGTDIATTPGSLSKGDLLDGPDSPWKLGV